MLFRRAGFRSITTTATTTSSNYLAGTVPSHSCYILLHTSQPPAQFPPRKSSAVQRALQLRVSKWGGIVNFSWSPDQPRPSNTTHSRYEPEPEPDVYPATAFSASRGRLVIPAISLANLNEVEERLREHVRPGPQAAPKDPQCVQLYVCTHGARDCRCGDVGGRVVRALRGELEKRRRRRHDLHDELVRVDIGEVGHVGGHKHAANLLVFPHGEWLGGLAPDDVPELMDAILSREPRPMTGSDTPLCPRNWRGRIGLSKEEQIRLLG